MHLCMAIPQSSIKREGLNGNSIKEQIEKPRPRCRAMKEMIYGGGRTLVVLYQKHDRTFKSWMIKSEPCFSGELLKVNNPKLAHPLSNEAQVQPVCFETNISIGLFVTKINSPLRKGNICLVFAAAPARPDHWLELPLILKKK